MSRAVVFFAFVLGACTVANPLYTPVDAGPKDASIIPTGSDGATNAPDLATPPGSECTAAQRTCTSTASQVCENGSYADDRTCPAGSVCADGYCGAPAGPLDTSCTYLQTGGQTEGLCLQGQGMGGGGQAAKSCQPFVTNGAISWVCDDPVGHGNPGTPCTTGSTCRSGFCGSNGTCFRACISSQDCPNQGNVKTCSPVMITVEGQQISVNSCVKGG